MHLLAPEDRRYHLRFRIGDGPSERGARVGGWPPADLDSRPLCEGMTYFLTFPLADTPELYASIFLAEFGDLMKALNDGFKTDSRVAIIPHTDISRGDSSQFASTLSSHPIVIGEQYSDLCRNDLGEVLPWSDHKFGGEPYCIQEPELPGARALFEQGFIQVLQLDFPNAADGNIDGDWPVGDGIFNVFWKPPFEGVPYYWYLQG